MSLFNIFQIIDLILFIIVAFTALYMTIFSLASLFNRHSHVAKSKNQNRFIILIPAYKCGRKVEKTVMSALAQTYPQRLFDVTVISDHLDEVTNFHLAQHAITLLTPNFEKSSKAKSLQLAINNLPQFKIYDVVVILDAGNIVESDFLAQLNDAFESAGTKAIQAHRLSANRDTVIARLDALFEEINNSIFRRGHITLGLSSAITGSGIAFEFNWFKQNIQSINTAWEDKELEARLMRQHIYVDYFDNILVYDEKTRQAKEFNQQRFRWTMSQLHILMSNIKYLPKAIINRHYNLIDKLIQWLLIPRMLMMSIIIVMCLITPFIYFRESIKWWVLFAFIIFIFALATPDYLVDKNWNNSFFKTPFLFLKSLPGVSKIANMFKKH